MEHSNAHTFCRLATREDLDQVVTVHLAAFDGFFLSILGSRFLKVMYTAFLEDSAGIFVVCTKSGSVQGFAVGAVAGGKKDRSSALRYLPQFVLAAMPALLKSPRFIVARLFKRFFGIGEAPTIPENSVMLRSIGVLPSAKGGGVAGSLLIEFEKLATAKNAQSVILTTDVDDNERAIGFYKKHGYSVLDKFRQDGKRMMYLMQKHIRGGL